MRIASEQHNPNVDATIRKYLTNKVREKFSEDFHLIEPIIDQLAARYSLKELYMICAVEISKRKSEYSRPEGRQATN